MENPQAIAYVTLSRKFVDIMQRISFSGNNDGSADYRTNSNGFLTTGTDKLFFGRK